MSMLDGFKTTVLETPIHELDPRVKMFMLASVTAMAIMFNKVVPLLVISLAQVPLVLLARVSREWSRSMRGGMIFALMIFGMNLVSRAAYAGWTVDAEMVKVSVAMALRFVALLTTFSLFFLTTSPDKLSLALESMRIPYEYCFAFTTAIRFIPIIAFEAQAIADAQRSRGLELDRGNLIERLKKYVPILTPLIVSAIRRSMELAEAMESRAFGASKRRTNLYTLELKPRDYVAAAALVAALCISVLVRGVV